MCQMSTFFQKRLNWYGHIRRREEDNISRKMMDIVVPGKRRRGRPRRRWIDNNREDMIKYELTADMNENKQYWKVMVKAAHKDVEIFSKGEKRNNATFQQNQHASSKMHIYLHTFGYGAVTSFLLHTVYRKNILKFICCRY